MADGVGDPSIALAVDRNSSWGITNFEFLCFARISGRETGNGVGTAVGDPDPVLLIDGQMERGLDLEGAVHGFAVHGAAEDAAFRGVALGQINDLTVPIVERPHVAIRGDDNALHLEHLEMREPNLMAHISIVLVGQLISYTNMISLEPL